MEIVMKKSIILLLTLFLSGINVVADENVMAVESVVDSSVNIVCEKPVEEKLELTWDEKSVIDSIKLSHKSKQLTQNNLKLFIESRHNHLNKDAKFIKELNVCAVLEKQKVII